MSASVSNGVTSRRATPEGTAFYRDTLGGGAARGHFRSSSTGLIMSSIGLGTYLGDEDDVSDGLYAEAIEWAIRSGCNVIDAAINYRCQRSERVIGRCLDALIREGHVRREQVVLASKGGFIPFDDHVPHDPQRYLQSEYMETGMIAEGELVAGCHCIAPSFLTNQLRQSLFNLGVTCIDVYYLHNPETQLQEISKDEFRGRMRTAFEFLEDQARAGLIGAYGIATWNGFRKTTRAREYLSLGELVQIARDVGGAEHRFRFIQLPYNLAMVEAPTLKAQAVEGQRVTLLEAARSFGITVVASASILQGRLTCLPADVAEVLPGLGSDAQRAIQFVRSTAGITTALVGMKGQRHVQENLALARVSPDPEAVEELLARAA